MSELVRRLRRPSFDQCPQLRLAEHRPSGSDRGSAAIDEDFAPLIRIGTAYNVLVVNPSVPVNSVAELVAYGKARTVPIREFRLSRFAENDTIVSNGYQIGPESAAVLGSTSIIH